MAGLVIAIIGMGVVAWFVVVTSIGISVSNEEAKEEKAAEEKEMYERGRSHAIEEFRKLRLIPKEGPWIETEFTEVICNHCIGYSSSLTEDELLKIAVEFMTTRSMAHWRYAGTLSGLLESQFGTLHILVYGDDQKIRMDYNILARGGRDYDAATFYDTWSLIMWLRGEKGIDARLSHWE